MAELPTESDAWVYTSGLPWAQLITLRLCVPGITFRPMAHFIIFQAINLENCAFDFTPESQGDNDYFPSHWLCYSRLKDLPLTLDGDWQRMASQFFGHLFPPRWMHLPLNSLNMAFAFRSCIPSGSLRLHSLPICLRDRKNVRG